MYPTKTADFFYNVSKLVFSIGSTNYWFDHMTSRLKFKIHKIISRIIDIGVLVFIVMELAAFGTQKNLTEKQKEHQILYASMNSMTYAIFIYIAKKKQMIREVIFSLVVEIKEVYNDVKVEAKMVKQSKFYLKLYLGLGMFTMLSNTLESVKHVIDSGAVFTTVITSYPDVEDKSTIAGITRVLICLTWICILTRMSSVFCLMIPLTLGLGHQFRNLSSYFCSLEKIFSEDLDQDEKEMKYEKALKIGIELHAKTLWCTQQYQDVFEFAYSEQILLKAASLTVVMAEMVSSDRDLTSVVRMLFSSGYLLISTGCLMWTAGDVTVEAALLPTAIYSSGWEHCTKRSSARIRPLVVIAMTASQTPVELKCLGIIKLSYESYVTIVKSSYSAFSVLY